MTEITPVTDEQRRARLAQAINWEAFHGWTVETRSDHDAVMTRKNKIHHGVHLTIVLVFLLILFPISFLWAIGWALIPVFRRTRVVSIHAAESGRLDRHETVRS